MRVPETILHLLLIVVFGLVIVVGCSKKETTNKSRETGSFMWQLIPQADGTIIFGVHHPNRH